MAAIVIIEAVALVEELEKVKQFWDEKGLDMHIAVKADGRLAVSTKHWGRVHYIRSDKNPEALWSIVDDVARSVGRSLILSVQGPYVYIPKLNVGQTQEIFNRFKNLLDHNNVERHFQRSWSIEDAVLPNVNVQNN